jgi:hypothetical protein
MYPSTERGKRMSITIQTDTGEATLKDDGGMFLDNSGYFQVLTPSQVEEAWSGDVISFSDGDVEELSGDYEGEELEEILAEGNAKWDDDNGYWDFGEELHTIPFYDEFHNPEED